MLFGTRILIEIPLKVFSEYKSTDKPSPNAAYRSFHWHAIKNKMKKATNMKCFGRPMHKQPHQFWLLCTSETVDMSFNTLNIFETFKLRRISLLFCSRELTGQKKRSLLASQPRSQGPSSLPPLEAEKRDPGNEIACKSPPLGMLSFALCQITSQIESTRSVNKNTCELQLRTILALGSKLRRKLRTVPTNSKVCLRGLLNSRVTVKQIFTSVIEIKRS